MAQEIRRRQQEEEEEWQRQQQRQQQQGSSKEEEKDQEEGGSCTCGQCIEGILSPHNAGWIAVAADVERNELKDLISIAERSGEFGSRGRREPLSRGTLRAEHIPLGRCLLLLPEHVQRYELYKSFIQGFQEAFDTINRVVEDGELPDADRVLRNWQDGHWSGGNKHRFLSRGGSVELAISHVLRTAREFAEECDEGTWDEAGKPRCANDGAWDSLADCLLQGGWHMNWSDSVYECSSGEEDEEDDEGW